MMKNKNTMFKIAALVFFAAFLICCVMLFNRFSGQKKVENNMESMKETFTVSGTEYQEEKEDILTKLGIEVPPRDIDFAALQLSNPDIYAWIYVPGTSIDYPVVQHPSDDIYYLDHNLDGSTGLPGTIYTEPSVNKKDFKDFNTVMYGHNMKNGTMFATLHRFKDAEFFNENRYIYIYMPEHIYVYQIFGAYTYNDVHLLKGINMKTKEAFQSYIDDIFAVRGINNNFLEDASVTSDNHILTLSTCTSQNDKRFLVQGVLLNGE